MRPFGSIFLGPLVPVGDTLFFTGELAPADVRDLWKSDGTMAGTRQVALLPEQGRMLTPVGETAFFAGSDPGLGVASGTANALDEGRRRRSTMAKILLGFDGSEESRRAAWKAAELAASRGSTLVVAQIVPPIIVPGDLPTFPLPELSERQLNDAEREVGKLLKDLAGSGARLESIVRPGFPVPELLRVSENDPDVEMVVVGRAGKGAIARALMGSVSSRLAHACVKPVLIVP